MMLYNFSEVVMNINDQMEGSLTLPGCLRGRDDPICFNCWLKLNGVLTSNL